MPSLKGSIIRRSIKSRRRPDRFLGCDADVQRPLSDWDDCLSRLNRSTLETHAAARLNNLKRTRFRPECPTASEKLQQICYAAQETMLEVLHRPSVSPVKRPRSRRPNIKMFQMARAPTQRHLLEGFRRTSTPPSLLETHASSA